MTREGHLQFCKKCINRQLDPKQGLICSLTQKIADFEDECKDFQKDASVKEEATGEQHLTNSEVIQTLSEDILNRLKVHQNLGYAIAGGALVAFISALIWALITVSTEFQIGYMAVGVGLLVGIGVRIFGAGVDASFGYVGAFFALLGCLLGNLLSQVGFIAEAQTLGYFETLTYLDFPSILTIFQESFSPIDFLFYAIAVYEGYKFAFRPVTPELIHELKSSDNYDPVPAYQHLRLPLVVVSLGIMGFTMYNINKGVSGPTTYYYESGAKLSSGELLDGELEGEWAYWYENGKVQAKAFYQSGIEEGPWKWFDEEEQLIKYGEYQKGLPHGVWINYYANGQPSDSGSYAEGRMKGLWKNYYENGQTSQQASYQRDRLEGEVIYYYENGKISAKGNFIDGEPSGMWENWFDNGNKNEKLAYDQGEVSHIYDVWTIDGKHIVKDGEGQYRDYYEDGKLAQSGEVKAGKRSGKWTSYYANGNKREEGKYEDKQYFVLNTWSPDGDAEVINGSGTYVSYYDNGLLLEQGKVIDGLKEGKWQIFYQSNGELMQVVEFKQGKHHGMNQTFYENGQLYAEGQLQNDKSEGEWIWYYENGMVQTRVNYQSDKKQGIQPFWNESGIKVKEETYEDNKLMSEVILRK